MSHGELATVFSELQPQLAALAAQRQLVFIDLSADFRLDGSDRYEKYYGHSHACPQYLSAFVFGLPELNRTALRQAQWIACPGCIATAICLTLLPLHSVDGLGLIAVASSTGSSGSGIHPSRTTHHPGRAQDFRTYNTLHHRHQGEAELVMEAGGARGYVLSLVPQSAPLVRGIFVAMQCLLPPQLDGAQAQALFLQRYAGEPFVRVVERSPRVAVVAGSNYAEIGVTVHDGRLAVCCALDNLGKGMAGTAIHNMNLALGLPETTGLAQAGVYP
jgi:N-acetyl-gamma-glutamyl-phosphate reductase